MSYKLIACPICNTRYPIVLRDLIKKHFRCICENCHAQTETFKYEAQAIDAWNKGKVEAERQ